MAKRPKFSNYKEYMVWRLDQRVDWVKKRAEYVKTRYISKLPDSKEFLAGEDDRIWLDQFVKGRGFDICCGDFLIGEDIQAEGVDGHKPILGTDYWSEGDSLSFQKPNELDFIVTNYLDGMPDPLKALSEWHRCIKPGGTIAVVCRNAEAYPDLMGPLANARRQSCYTSTTLAHYLYRVGFEEVKIECHSLSLRAHAKKPK